MSIDWKSAAMAFGTGVMEGDEKIRKENLLIHGEKLKAKRDAIIDMKKSKFKYDMDKYDANKTKMDSLNAVSSDLDAGKFDYKEGDTNYVEGKKSTNTFKLGEAFLTAKYGQAWLVEQKKYKLGAEGDPTAWIEYVEQIGNNPNIKNELKNVEFKSRDTIEGNYLASIQKIEDKYADALKKATGDSPLTKLILGKKKEEIDNLNIDIETDKDNVKTISESNKYITKKSDGEISTDTVDVKEEVTADGERVFVDTKKSVFIPLTFKTDYADKLKVAKDVNYSSKQYNKQIADTLLTLIPDAKKDDYFTENKDGELIAKESIINADVMIQSLISKSLEDLSVEDTFNSTNGKKSKIDFNANKRYNLAKTHIEEYGSWVADDKILSDSGSLKNLFSGKSTALVVPANSIININNNNLKGYDIIIPKELRTDVGKVYRNFIIAKAKERMQDKDLGGGTLEYNINVLQRALSDDNDGNQQLTKDARAYIAEALIDAKYKVNKIGVVDEVETETKYETTTDMSPPQMEVEKEKELIKKEDERKVTTNEDKLYEIEMVSNKPGHKTAVVYLPTQANKESPVVISPISMATISEARATLKYAKKAKFNDTVIKKIEAHIKSLRGDINQQIKESSNLYSSYNQGVN